MYIFEVFRHPISIELLVWTLSAFLGFSYSFSQVVNTWHDYTVVKQFGSFAQRAIARGNFRREIARMTEQLLFLFVAFEVAFFYPPLPKGVSIHQLPKPTIRGELFSAALIIAAGLVTFNTYFDRRDRKVVAKALKEKGK